MKNALPHVISTCLCMLLLSCAAHRQEAELAGEGVQNPTSIAVSPVMLGFQGSLTQIVSGQFGEKADRLRFEVNISENQLILVGLTSVGLPAFSIKYDGHDVDSKVLIPGVSLPDPGWILADFLLSNAPYSVLKPLLTAQAMDIEESLGARQILSADGMVLVAIEYEKGEAPRFGQSLSLHNLSLGYELDVQTTLHKPEVQ